MIQRRSRCCLIATTTFLAARFVRGYNSFPPGAYSRASASARRASSSAVSSPLLSLPTSPTSPVCRRSCGTRLMGERTPMIGPALQPAAPPVDSDGNELSKPTKRKVAIVVGYVGSGFHGWQQSTDNSMRTVEGVLETALWKAGAIADSNYGDLNKIGWGRTSRTDKGVHASKTVAAAKLLLPQETFSEKGLSQYGKDKLNEHLPVDVRCFSVAKVPKSFRGRDECTLRTATAPTLNTPNGTKQEYSYYLPKHLLRSGEELSKFRELLKHFVGTHSFHNYANTKGRQLKEVRRRVQASIDLKKASGDVSSGGGEYSKSSPCAAEGGNEEASAKADGGRKRQWSKDDWRTYRHKKMSLARQKEEDDWHKKPSAGSNQQEGGGGESTEAPASEVAGGVGEAGVVGGASGNVERGVSADSEVAGGGGNAGRVVGDDLGDAEGGVSADISLMDLSADAAHAVADRDADAGGDDNHDGVGDGNGGVGVGGEDYDVGKAEDDTAQMEAGDDGPAKVLLLRELRTSIYRCEALDDIVRCHRKGQPEADEFIRIDVRGKAFVYNQIRLMIGGALGEARGDLMPGFVEAALKTPYRLRVPLAPAEGLVLESQAFTRHANAHVLDPRELGNIGGTLAVWGTPSGGKGKDSDRESTNGNNGKMQTRGRLQSLLTLEQLEEAERWRDEHIVPAVAEAWAARGAAELFLLALQKFFVGQQQEEPLLKAIRDNLSEIAENERLAEEKHNRFRQSARESGSTRCKELLPKNVATQIVCKFRMLPGNKVNAVQRGVVKHMDQGHLPPLAENDEVLAFISKIGLDQIASDGGFVAPDIDATGGCIKD